MWIDYLSSPDAMYPTWFKYYAFQGMLKLAKFDKENQKFKKRSIDTSGSFIELNPNVLNQIYIVIQNKIVGQNQNLTDDQVQTLAAGESFQKLYTYFLANENPSTDGVWVKYEQGDEYMPLWQSLYGKNTEWCIADIETAKNYMLRGDLYVYYTVDDNNEYTNPRVAIRMDGKNSIAEVRGIASNQNIEGSMAKIVEEKLDEFSDKNLYKKKVHDMNLLTTIYNKQRSNIKLTKDELRFLYEIDDEIKGFGWNIDPRIHEIKSQRNIKEDLSFLFNVDKDAISLTEDEFKEGKTVVHVGYLNIDNTNIHLCKNLQYIMGDLFVDTLEDSENLENLQEISGNAHFNLKDAKHLKNLQIIRGDAKFFYLKNAFGLSNLQIVRGNAYFKILKSAKGLNSLQIVGEDAYFNSLEDATDLKSLRIIGGNGHFKSLVSALGLNSLQMIGKNAYFNGLVDALGLNSLQIVGEDAYFNSLKNAAGLISLRKIGWHAYFDLLEDSTGLGSLQEIGGEAYFNLLKNAADLISLRKIGWHAYFNSLEDATGLSNLQEIGGEKHFDSLVNIEPFISSNLCELFNTINLGKKAYK